MLIWLFLLSKGQNLILFFSGDPSWISNTEGMEHRISKDYAENFWTFFQRFSISRKLFDNLSIEIFYSQ